MNQRLCTAILGSTFALLALVTTTAAQDCIRYDQYLRWLGGLYPSSAIAVALAGPLAVTVTPASVDIVEVAATGVPTSLGSFDLEGGRDVAVFGDRAYVAASNQPEAGGRLVVVDLSDPQAPVSSTTVTLPRPARCVALADNLILVGTGEAGPQPAELHVLDPASPGGNPELGAVSLPDAVLDVAVVGQLAFLAVRDAGLQVVDLTDPTDPVVIGASASCAATRVAGGGGLALVTTSEPALRVYDMTDPSAPALLAAMPLTGIIGGLAATGAWAVVAADPAGLMVVDVSAPAQPSLAGGWNGEALSDLAAVGDRVVALTDGGALQVLALGSGDEPDLPAALAWDGCDALDVTVAGDRVYVADGNLGLSIVDVTDPRSPVLLSQTATAERASGVSVAGDRAYVVDKWPSSIYVFDVADPLAVGLLGMLALPAEHSVTGVTVAGGHAYLTGYCSGVISCDALVMDISSPEAIEQVGALGVSGFAKDIVVVGGRAYVAVDNTSFGLQIFDVADPASAFLLGRLEVGLVCKSVAVVGEVAYLVDGAWGLFTIDVSDPTAPVLLAQVELPGSSYDVGVADDVAYVANRDAGCQVIGVDDPAQPVLLGGVDTPGDALCLGVDAGRVFVGDNGHGLAVTWRQCQATASRDDDPPPHSMPAITAAPNPFNPRVQLAFTLDEPGFARLTIHDLTGRCLGALAEGPWPAGKNVVEWLGRDEQGRLLASGTYLVRLVAGGRSVHGKVTLLR